MSSKKVPVLAKTMAEMQLEDPRQTHYVPQMKLLSSYSQRISSIMENCIARVKLAANLPAILQWISVSGVDEKFSRAIDRYNILDGRLESSGEQKDEDGTRAQLKRDFKNSVRDLLRLIRDHPDVISGWEAQPGIKLGEGERTVIRGLEEFYSLMVERLMTNEEPEESLTKREESQLKQLILGEEKMAASIKELDGEIAQKACELEELNSKEKAQQAAMAALKDEQSHSVIKTSDPELCSIQQEIDRVKVQLNTLILKNKEEERMLMEQKNKKVEEQIEDLLQNFDKEMEKMTAKLDANKTELEREEEELRQLETPFSALEVEYNQIVERRRLAEEKRKQELMELELKTKAAIIAQAWWRGYSTRKALKNKDKSKKSQKGKGKKTKKK